jgi:CheY-like chemotaxis protein
MKILIADDERDFVKSLKSFLERKGHFVDAAFDGGRALELMKKNNYDLAFLDHNMPELTGLELVKFVEENGLRTKTVLLTGYPTMKDFFARALGADEYIRKPCQLEDIASIVDKYQRGKTQRDNEK